MTRAVRWTLDDGGTRRHVDCGGEVYAFREGHVCSLCGMDDDPSNEVRVAFTGVLVLTNEKVAAAGGDVLRAVQAELRDCTDAEVAAAIAVPR